MEQNEPCAEKKSSLLETRTRGTCLGSVALQLERVLFELNTLHGTIGHSHFWTLVLYAESHHWKMYVLLDRTDVKAVSLQVFDHRFAVIAIESA